MNKARYLYCIADGGRKVDFGEIGIESNMVYTIPYKDLCAVVHNCPSEPYKSEDNERVKSWIITHENVIETAWPKFGTVLPFGFDTILSGDGDVNAKKNIKEWLKEDYKRLRQKLDKFRGKAEFGVQIFWIPEKIAEHLPERNKEIEKLKSEINAKSGGFAYMYRQKLEILVRKQMEMEAKKYFTDFYKQIKRNVDEIKVEKTKKSDEGRQMLMNLSCLLLNDKNKFLGEELEKIDKRKEFFVRFTGPWPPYSFV